MAIFGISIGQDVDGFTELDMAGENLIAGDLCYLAPDSKYYKASALAKSTSTTELRIALNSIPIDTQGIFLIRGKFDKAGLIAGDKYYASETYGAFTNVQPNGTATNVIRYIGTAWSDRVLEFNQDVTYILADGTEVNEVTVSGTGGSAHVIQEESTPLVARPNLNFIGTGVTATDNPGNSATDITILDSGAHSHSNFALLETYTQTEVDLALAVTNTHSVYDLGSKTVDETGLTNEYVLSFNSTSGDLEYVPQSGGVTDHTLLTNIGTNTHAQIDTHIADGTIHFTQAAISITESQISDLGPYEDYLGVPAVDGYVLTSTVAGVRTWNNIAGGTPEADTLDTVTGRGNTTTNSISTAAITSSGIITGTEFTSAGNLLIESNAGFEHELKSAKGIRLYIDSNNDDVISALELLANVSVYGVPDVVFSVSQTGVITVDSGGTSTEWDLAYDHSLLVTGNPHGVNGAQVVLTGYVIPGSTSAVLATDSTNAAIGKLEKAIDDINTSGPMTSFTIEEGNGTETSTVTNGETIKFAQGTGIEVELTSAVGGGTLTFTNTDPNVNLIHTGEVTGATALTVSSDVIDLDNLIVGGTAAVTKFLRYDSAGSGLTWDTPVDLDTWRPVNLNGSGPIGDSENLQFLPSNGVNITEAAGTFTFSSNHYWSMKENGVFKEQIGYTESVDFVDGVGINVTGTTIQNPSLTFDLADNGVNALQLNVSGNGTTSQYLRSDADGSFTWAIPPDNNTIYVGWNLFTNGTNRGNIASGENVNFISGTNLSLSYSVTNNAMTFNVDDAFLKNNADDTTTGSLTATAFYESSLRELKENIEPFKESGLDLVKGLDIVTYDKKDGTIKDKIGIIIDESPKEFANEEHDKVDLYKTIFIQAKAIQELSDKLEKLEKIINGISR